MSLSIYNKFGKATMHGLQAPGRVHFWHSRQRMRHPAPVADNVHGFSSKLGWSSTASCPAVSAMPLGIAGEQRATALGMSVEQLNACTSQGKGQRCCEVKSCALKIRSPNEQKVPGIIWKEAVKVSFSKDNDRDYSCRELQMFCEKKQTSLKLLSGK